MYKKVTHQIVEEHFAHPMAAELKKKVDKVVQPNTKKVNTPPKGYIYEYDFSPLSIIEKRSINRWACLNWRLRSLVISITEGDKDIDLLKERMADDINKISEIVAECYGADGARAFNKLLSDVTLALVDVLMLIKADKETTPAMTVLGDANKALGDFLESVNSSWPSQAVVDIFTQVENLYITQAISRIKKEWAAGVAAADNAYNIMVVEQDNGDPSFADIFSKGILDCIEQTIVKEITDITGA